VLAVVAAIAHVVAFAAAEQGAGRCATGAHHSRNRREVSLDAPPQRREIFGPVAPFGGHEQGERKKMLTLEPWIPRRERGEGPHEQRRAERERERE
jgi:hypothetical protein